MEELKKVLLEHANKYPKMNVSDAVKLIYQNEFGGGHLILNPENSLKYLIYECHNTVNFNQEYEYEDIGNGLVRVNLYFIKDNEEKIRKINEIFVTSANEHKGNLNSFIEKLDLLRTLTIQNNFNFSIMDLDEYLKEYKKNNYPMVSHSQTYKDNYYPSYRIVLKKYINKA
jgi:hypothetical protein